MSYTLSEKARILPPLPHTQRCMRKRSGNNRVLLSFSLQLFQLSVFSSYNTSTYTNTHTHSSTSPTRGRRVEGKRERERERERERDNRRFRRSRRYFCRRFSQQHSSQCILNVGESDTFFCVRCCAPLLRFLATCAQFVPPSLFLFLIFDSGELIVINK